MKKLALLLAIVFTAAPAQACHRFSIWRFTFPQRCGAHPVAPAVEDRWYVEITRMPDGVDEDRAIGIEALKRALHE